MEVFDSDLSTDNYFKYKNTALKRKVILCVYCKNNLFLLFVDVSKAYIYTVIHFVSIYKIR